MDETVNRQDASRQDAVAGDGDQRTDQDGFLHLIIDANVVNNMQLRNKRPPRPSTVSVNKPAEEPDSLGTLLSDLADRNLHNISSSEDPNNVRMRSLSDSHRSVPLQETGIQIPHRHPSRYYTQHTPPLSYSPAIEPHNPYSTSGHLYPAKGLPDTPQSSTVLPKRSQTTLRSSLHSKAYKSTYPELHENIPRSMSCSFDASGSQTFVDASSYDSVPDSPAKLWLQVFAATTVPTPAPDDEGQEIGQYVIGRQIGVGGFSVVKEAFTYEQGKEVQHAVKIVKKHVIKDNEALQSHFDHEIAVWKCLSNRYVLPLLSVIETDYATWAFTYLFLGGSLHDVFKVHRQGLPPALALKYSYQLAQALRYLHQDARVVHRDVKLENCVLDRPFSEGGNLRLCDFGLADFLPGDDTPSPRTEFITPRADVDEKPNNRPEDMVVGGSLAYAAPEQIQSNVPLLDTAIDMWSFGVVVHALTMGELPFYDPFPPKLQTMIAKGKWNVERLAARVDAEVCEVIKGCLEMDPAKRWTVDDVLKSQWMSQYAGDDEM